MKNKTKKKKVKKTRPYSVMLLIKVYYTVDARDGLSALNKISSLSYGKLLKKADDVDVYDYDIK